VIPLGWCGSPYVNVRMALGAFTCFPVNHNPDYLRSHPPGMTYPPFLVRMKVRVPLSMNLPLNSLTQLPVNPHRECRMNEREDDPVSAHNIQGASSANSSISYESHQSSHMHKLLALLQVMPSVVFRKSHHIRTQK